MSIISWVREHLVGDSRRSNRDKIRKEVRSRAAESREEVVASRQLRHLAVADYQYKLRVQGRGRQ